jgi:hypothetical protein
MRDSLIDWAYLYLGIGVIIALIFYGLSLKDRPSQFVKDMRAALGYGKTLKDHLQDILVYTLAGLTIVIGWPGFLIWAAQRKIRDQLEHAKRNGPQFICKPKYLVRKLSLIEAEQENLINDPLGLTPNLPFGHLNSAWTKFLSEFGLEDENELWYFEIPIGSPISDYLKSTGPTSGYAKVVKGKVVGEFVIEAD